MTKKAMSELLADKNIGLYWAEEVYGRSHKAKGWVGGDIGDVGVSLREGAVCVPHRRIGSYHWSEALHEIAHLELWRWQGKTPTNHYEPLVCQLAIDIANQYGFGKDTLTHLAEELGRVQKETFASVKMNAGTRAK